MAIEVACPNCETVLAVTVDTLGKRIRCKTCRETFTADAGAVADAAEDGEAGSAKSSALRAALLVGSLTGGAALAVFAIILVIRLTANPEPLRRAAASVGGYFTEYAALWLVLLCLMGMVAYVVLVVATMVWVARDADSRGHSGVGWAVVYTVPHLAVVPVALPLVPVFGIGIPFLVFGWVGLLVYSTSRRLGRLVRCKTCPNRRLEYVATCPHCGRA